MILSYEIELLTPRQRQIARAIASITDDGWPAGVREIGRRVGLASTSTVHAHLRRLLSLGIIEQNPRSQRGGFRLSPSVDRADL